jgi:serine/threonine protein kinase
MHRDLKLDNILIHFPNFDIVDARSLRSEEMFDEEFVIKIADLGYARELTTH